MSIVYNERERLISLHTLHSSYQMAISEYGHLLHLYYGRRAEGSFLPMLSLRDRGFSGNPYSAGHRRGYSLDSLPQELSSFGNGDYRDSGLRISDRDGACGVELLFEGLDISPGKYRLDGGLPCADGFEGADIYDAETLEIRLRDERSGLLIKLLYAVYESEDIITRAMVVHNSGKSGALLVERADSAVLDFIRGSYDLVHFSGRYGNERLYHRERLTQGRKRIGSLRGSSSHQHNPFAILCSRDCNEENGAAYAVSLVYSGSFHISAELDQLGQTRLSTGIMDEQFCWQLAEGESLTVPEAVLCFSEGFSELSHRMHSFIEKHIINGAYTDRRRPVLLNSWEGCYFDFDGQRMLKIADAASELGIELLVMDDGWFGKRDNDLSGLGDWYSNEKKLGMSLSELADGVRSRGLSFGIWIEPEMVSEDSDLYREHPDYALVIPGKKPVRSRHQLVLDFSRPEVVERVLGDIVNTLSPARPDYIKMDMNRSIMEVYSHGAEHSRRENALLPQNRGRLLHLYTLGVYRFIEGLRRAFPNALIEGCSGGGGRFDLGMLCYTPQIWLSDNTDAVERLALQYGASFGYPLSSVGSHVSAVPNHQTGRSTAIETRAIVALSGSFGYELDPTALADKERQEIRREIELYKRFYELNHKGLYYRLSGASMGNGVSEGYSVMGQPDSSEYTAWMLASRGGDEALLSIVTRSQHCNAPVEYVALRGLNRDMSYRLELCMSSSEAVLPEELDKLLSESFTGAVLMEYGIPVPLLPGEYQSLLFHIREV